MDEHLRQLRRVATSSGDPLAWQAYSRGLERMLGIADEPPSDATGIDALLAHAGAAQKLSQELRYLQSEDNRLMADELLTKMATHGATFFTFQTSTETEQALRATATENDRASGPSLGRQLTYFENLDPKWYLFDTIYYPGVRVEGMPTRGLKIQQLKARPTTQDAFSIAREATGLYIASGEKLASILLKAVLGRK